jgi:hypothetical protein
MLAVWVSSLSQNTAISTKCAGVASFHLGVDALEIDPLVEPLPDPVIAAIGNAREQRRSTGNHWLRSDEDEDPLMSLGGAGSEP